MSTGFEFFDENGQVQFSSENVAYLLLDVFDITRNVNGTKSYALPAGMSLAANIYPNDIAEYVHSFLWDKDTPKVTGILNISVSGSDVSWSWIGGNNHHIAGATVRVFAR